MLTWVTAQKRRVPPRMFWAFCFVMEGLAFLLVHGFALPAHDLGPHTKPFILEYIKYRWWNGTWSCFQLPEASQNCLEEVGRVGNAFCQVTRPWSKWSGNRKRIETPSCSKIGRKWRQFGTMAPYFVSGGILVGWVHFTLKSVGSIPPVTVPNPDQPTTIY